MRTAGHRPVAGFVLIQLGNTILSDGIVAAVLRPLGGAVVITGFTWVGFRLKPRLRPAVPWWGTAAALLVAQALLDGAAGARARPTELAGPQRHSPIPGGPTW